MKWISNFSLRECVKEAFFFVVVLTWVFTPLANATHRLEQRVALQKGWNAVELTVRPDGLYPTTVFSNSVVDIVAHLDVKETLNQFVTDPTVDLMRQAGWRVWYAPSRADSFLTDLTRMDANESYLIHATEAGELVIWGDVEWDPHTWKPASFNLIGFSLDPQSPPTFEEFFAGSAAHAGQPIYRMAEGVWREVLDPAATFMRDGEAFWIYCADASDYGGPVSVETASAAGVYVADELPCDLIFKNTVGFPVEVTLVHQGDAEYVPLSVVIRVRNEDGTGFSDESFFLGAADWSQSLPALQAGDSIRLPLTLRAAECACGVERKSLLCVKTDLGTELWVPVTGLREE